MDFQSVNFTNAAIVIAIVSAIYFYRKAHTYFNTPSAVERSLSLITDSSIIFIVDKDLDKKTSLWSIISPYYNGFDKPHKTCQDIKKIPQDCVAKVVLSTKGGSLASCEKIMKTLKQHEAGYIAYICGESYSAGAIIALGATEIVMGNSSYLGKIDPQEGDRACINNLEALERFPDHHNLNLTQTIESEHVMNYMEEILATMFQDHPVVDESMVKVIRQQFVYSKLPHCKLFDLKQCQDLGLHVREPREDELQYINVLNNVDE